jgi:hypothetical protein
MSSNTAHSTGIKVSAFLRGEKKSCKQMQKKILSEPNRGQAVQVVRTLTRVTEDMPAAIPQGKGFSILAENTEVKVGDPSVVARVLWKEKRSGEVFQGDLKGPPSHSLLLALTGLREKAQEMARAAK